jgi:hypothetical protein
MKKITTRQLESHLEWLNEHMESFNDGYAEYLHDKWTETIEQADKEGISLFSLTVTCFGNKQSSDPFTQHLFDYTIENQNTLAFFYNTKYEWDIKNLSLEQYKHMFNDLINTYTSNLMGAVKKNKNEQTLLNAKQLLYKETYSNLSF